jgi:Tle cognate immunity protein 4 C-terminal domain/Tle cognate immunity protein 4 N-terminal domain
MNVSNASADKTVRHKRLIVAAVASLLAVGLAVGLGQGKSLGKPNRGSEMTDVTKNMKTVCIGRYLIDIPKDADFSLGDSESDSVKIERIPSFASDTAYRERLRDYEKTLRTSAHKKEGRRLRSATPVNAGAQTVFVSRPTDTESFVSLVEVFVNAAPSAWRIFADVADEDVGPVSEAAASAASLLDGRKAIDVPTSKGACIRDGILTRLPLERETFNGGARVSALSWSISVTSETSGPRQPGKQLFDRVDRAIDMAGSNSGIKKLRRAKVEADGRSGQQYIAIYPDAQANILDAKLELYGTGQPQVPTIKLQMEVGSPRKADPNDPRCFMKDEDALALWDAMVKSIRPRPGAF